MTNYLFHPSPRNYHLIYWAFKAFTPEECKKIIDLYNSGKEVESRLLGDDDSLFTAAPAIRKSKNTWLPWNDENDWIFNRLHRYASKLNADAWNLQLSGFTEDLQLTKYEAPGGHYKWHTDSSGGKASLRKLSVVVQLSDPSEYEGGDFEAFEDPEHIKAPRGLGDIIVFPSYQLHRVKPVTKGTRHSLVAWISGEPFR